MPQRVFSCIAVVDEITTLCEKIYLNEK